MAVGGHGSHENVEETDDEPVKEQPAKKSKAKSTKKGKYQESACEGTEERRLFRRRGGPAHQVGEVVERGGM